MPSEPEPGAWSFDRPEVAAGFDAYVRSQLPWYDLATGMVANIAQALVPEGGQVYDIGAATGNISRALQYLAEARRIELVSIENAPAMAAGWQGWGTLYEGDVRTYAFQPCDLAVSFLTLMFLPVGERQHLISHLYGKLRDGGGLLIVERMLPEAGAIGLITSRLTLAAKYEGGTDPREIIRKELALEGVQRPLHLNELKRAPFKPVFRFGDFAGWLAIKDPG